VGPSNIVFYGLAGALSHIFCSASFFIFLSVGKLDAITYSNRVDGLSFKFDLEPARSELPPLNWMAP
jgi:hypothetical protein